MPASRSLNAWLDRLPRSHVRLGRSAVPIYLLCGLVGFVIAQLVVLSLCMLTERSILVGLALGPVSAAVMVVTSLGRRALTGSEVIVQQEQFAAVLGLEALGLAVAGLPVLEHLDLLSTGLALFLVFGRVGCFLGGCCFGVPCEIGVLYPRECIAGSVGARVRRLPTQLLDAGIWMLVFVVSAILLFVGRHGAATIFGLIAHGVGRFALEQLRGDARPHLLGLSEGRWLGIGGVLVGLVLAASLRQWPVRELVVVGGAMVIAFVGLVTRRWWLDLSSGRPPSDVAERLERLADTCAAFADEQVHATQVGAVSIGLRRVRGERFELSIFRENPVLSRAEAEVWFSALLRSEEEPLDLEVLSQSPRGVWIMMTRASGVRTAAP